SFAWARSVGGYRHDTVANIATDAQGNVYAAGHFEDTVDIDPLDGTYLLSATGATGQAGYVLKLDPAGRFRWAVPLVGTGGAADAFGIDTDGGRGSVGGEATVPADFDPSGAAATDRPADPVPCAP